MIQYNNRGKVIIKEGTEDPRYMVRLFLIRQERPKYWNFYCMYCGNKLCELNGTVIYMTDISSEGASTSSMTANRIRCNSRQCGGRAWFEFQF